MKRPIITSLKTPRRFRIRRPELVAAVREVLDYLCDDERADYQSRAPEDREGHIFESLAVVSRWVAEQEDHDHRLRRRTRTG